MSHWIRLRIPLRAAAPIWAAACLAGCYTYTRPIAVAPDPDRTLAFELTDQARAALSAAVGTATDRIEGRLVAASDTAYAVSVARVVDLRGRIYPWNGEMVSLRREYVGAVRERRVSTVRTGFVVGAVTSSLVAFIVTRGLGVGGTTTDRQPGENPGGGVVSVMFPLTLIFSR